MTIFRTAYQRFVHSAEALTFFPLLAIRLYLAPVMIQAGWTKLISFADTAAWFGNPDWGLGLPFPALLAALAIGAELVGGILILVGLLTRLAAIPLLATMGIAMGIVHWQHGWPAIADASSWLADGTLLYNEAVMAAPEKLKAANAILAEHGYIDWLTASGKFVILNNGIEFAATYFVMLLVLLCQGGGRFVSIDYFLARARRE